MTKLLELTKENPNEIEDLDDLSGIDMNSEHVKKLMSLWGSITDETFFRHSDWELFSKFSGSVTRNIDLNAELAEGLEEKYARIN